METILRRKNQTTEEAFMDLKAKREQAILAKQKSMGIELEGFRHVADYKGCEINVGKAENGSWAWQIYKQGQGHLKNSGPKFKTPGEAAAAAKKYIDEMQKQMGSALGTKLAKSSAEILKIANQVESAGVGTFDRSGEDMIIWIRCPTGNDPKSWENARRIASAIGPQASEPKADAQSGKLVIKVKGAYKKQMGDALASGKILWWDARDGNGVVTDAKGKKFYIDSSVVKSGEPKSGKSCDFDPYINSGVACGKNVRVR